MRSVTLSITLGGVWGEYVAQGFSIENERWVKGRPFLLFACILSYDGYYQKYNVVQKLLYLHWRFTL